MTSRTSTVVRPPAAPAASRLRILAPGLLALAPLLSGACTTVQHLPDEQTTLLAGGTLQQAQPADVAVLPVRNQSGDENVPVARMRDRLYHGLLDRLYSPLDVEFVDARWEEAALDPAVIDADAALNVVITGWNTRWLDDIGVLVAVADVYLIEPGGTAEHPIWGLSLTRRIDLADAQPALGGRSTLYGLAADRLTAEILALLPARDPTAEPR